MFVAVQALRLHMIDEDEFLRACQTWAKDKEIPLASVLEEHGRIDGEQREQLEALLDKEQKRGNTRTALGKIASLDVRDTMRVLRDRDVQKTVAGLPPAGVRIAPPQAPLTTTGRYTLTREYSEGGLSRIWLARDANLHRDVILKELHPGLIDNEETRHRFMNEAQITGQLEHPNIVPVYELGPKQGEDAPFYTMRFVRGQTLQSAIQAYHDKAGKPGASLEHRRLLGHFISVCNAIAYAHSRGVLHRDLKPQNVVIGDFGEVILLDWGLAKLSDGSEVTNPGVELPDDHDPQMTAEGAILGTPAYLAPELATGSRDDVSELTDVYGLGAILYEILTGQPPHHGKTAADVIKRVISEPSPRAEDANPATPAPLNAICAKAMAKNQGERYGSASELAEEVHRWLGDEPVAAFREPPMARLKRWTRRHRFASLAAAMLLITLAVGFLNMWWQKNRAIEQEIQRLGRESLEESGRLSALIDILVDDVGFLADTATVDGIFEPSEAGDTVRTDLAATFLEFLRHRPEYFQARLLASDGMEIVRVERTAQRAPYRNVKLQNKKEAPYFAPSIRLPRGRVYLSRVELNRENGEIAKPEVPVIRAAMPVLSRAPGGGDVRRGFVIINTDFGPLFKMLEGAKEGARRKGRLAEEVCVTNRDGFFLFNPKAPHKTFGFEPEKGMADDPSARIQHVYPALSAFYGSGRDTYQCVSGDGAGRKAVFASRLHLVSGQEDRSLVLAAIASYDAIEARAEDDYRVPQLVTYALMVALGALLVFALLLARRRDREMRAGAVDPLAVDRTTGGTS